jgi:flagellar motor switch protein FliN
MSQPEASSPVGPDEKAFAPSRQRVEKTAKPAAVPAEAVSSGEVLTRPAGFAQLNQGNAAAPSGTPIDYLLDVTVTMTAELGHTTMPLGDVLKLGVGSVVELDRFVGELVDLAVKGVLLARGEVVVVEDRFAIRIKEIMKPKQGPGEKHT